MKFLVITLALVFASSPVFAGKEKCKDVKIVVKNESNRDIKAVDIKYWDSTIGDWRNENGVSGKTAEQEGGEAEYTRGLEEVKNDPGMKVKVQYKINKLGKWKDPTWSNSSPVATCTKGQTYTVTVN